MSGALWEVKRNLRLACPSPNSRFTFVYVQRHSLRHFRTSEGFFLQSLDDSLNPILIYGFIHSLLNALKYQVPEICEVLLTVFHLMVPPPESMSGMAWIQVWYRVCPALF